MFAGSGHGPFTPAVPAAVLARRVLAGELEPGARACVNDISLSAVEKEVEHLDFNFAHLSSDRSTEVQKDMFSLAFGENIANNFPKFMRKFHGGSKSPLRAWHHAGCARPRWYHSSSHGGLVGLLSSGLPPK